MALKTFDNQSKLPPLPIPDIKESCAKYLKSLKPLLNQKEWQYSQSLLEDFCKPEGDGEYLQKKLLERNRVMWTKGKNWLEDWWTNYAYLLWPDPIAVKSNFYIICDDDSNTGIPQAYQAARMIRGMAEFKFKVWDQEKIPPEYLDKQKKNPLDMNQFTKMFTTVRIPGEHGDQLITCEPTNNIVVICRNQYYVINILNNDESIVSVQDLEEQMNWILEDSMKNAKPQNGVGIATGIKRPEWAKIRNLLQKSESNKKILDTIQSCLFVVSLDEASPKNLDEQAHHIIGGDANNRWFDKIFQILVFKNGMTGVNGEHSPLDAPAMGSPLEYMLTYVKNLGRTGYPAGDQKSEFVPTPKKMKFEISQQIADMLKKAEVEYFKMWEDCDLKMLPCEEAAVKSIQSLRIGPDAFVQMAIQLTYFKMYQKGCATYETGHTRKFYHGRTDTVRTYSEDSDLFTKAMLNPNLDPVTKLKHFLKALQSHTEYMKDVINGKGCDRHLLGLRILAMEEIQQGIRKELPPIFTDPAFAKSTYYQLSTSNIPGAIQYCGGFAAVVPDGYGVCYISRKNIIMFGITSWKSCPETDSAKFRKILHESVIELKQLVINYGPQIMSKL